ncbi:MAG: hypothetical protein GXP25_19915 [Planctomycetes bacterium]|nr:hypothetical protein [Planctomycetota bacterium]
MNSPKRIALYSLIVALVISALIGIYALLHGEFDWFEMRILLTSVTISGGSMCSLACASLAETRKKLWLPAAGILLSALTVLFILYGIWADVHDDTFWKVVMSLGVATAATAHVCLLSHARLSSTYIIASVAADIAIATLALLILALIWIEDMDSITWFRLLGVNSIVVAVLSIMLPILHKLSATEAIGETKEEDAPQEMARSNDDLGEIPVLCPQCEARFKHAPGKIECGRCGCMFRVEVYSPGKETP